MSTNNTEEIQQCAIFTLDTGHNRANKPVVVKFVCTELSKVGFYFIINLIFDLSNSI